MTFYILVPTPTVSATAANTQTVGQSLTLQCEVTTVSSGGIEPQGVNNVSSTTMNNSLVCSDSYTTSQLTTTDEGRVIHGEVVNNESLPVMTSDSITLDVIGMFISIECFTYVLVMVIINLHTVPTPTVTISPSGPIQGAMVGSPLVINCTASTVSGVESSLVMISWMGPGGGSIMGNSRMIISPTTSSGNDYTSSLQFNYLMEGDEGTYTCNVTILETTVSQSVELESLIG